MSQDSLESLKENLAKSREVQRKLKWIAAGGIALTVASFIFSTWLGIPMLFSTLFTLGIGYYITGMRIMEWKELIYELEHSPPSEER